MQMTATILPLLLLLLMSELRKRYSCPSPAPTTLALDGRVVDDLPLLALLAFYRQLPLMEMPPELEGFGVVIKSLSTARLNSCLRWYFNQPLPLTNEMFPWLHGLHEENFAQRQFFLNQQFPEFRPVLVDKPRVARFLMCVDTDEDSAVDPFTTHFLTPHNFHNYRHFDTQNVLKNTVKLKDVLRKVDVLRAEVRCIVYEIFSNLFPDSIDLDPVVDVFTRDCLLIKFLPIFLNLDPDRGVSLRNFHIQVAKLASCLDFIVYGNHHIASFARVLWLAQQHEAFTEGLEPAYAVYTHLGAVADLDGQLLWKNDYIVREKVENMRMALATKINGQVWAGNYWDYHSFVTQEHKLSSELKGWPHMYCDPDNLVVTSLSDFDNVLDSLPQPKANWRLLFHCHSDARFPNPSTLSLLIYKCLLRSKHAKDNQNDKIMHLLDFPPLGSVGIGDCKPDNLALIVNTCKLIYMFLLLTLQAANVELTLIYCNDGYTELLLLVLLYLMYLLDISLGDAMITLHTKYGRPFYIFPSDAVILEKLEALVRKFSPLRRQDIDWLEPEKILSQEINEILLGSPSKTVSDSCRLGFIANELDEEEVDDAEETLWVTQVEGSLPLRILPYLYLGSLKHANCPAILTKLGITKIISVGESLDWIPEDSQVTTEDNGNIEMISVKSEYSVDTVMKVNNLLDDGIDELSQLLPRILQFLNDEYTKLEGQVRILVHCRVGVSRSATVAIAEVMRRLEITIPNAYLYVRVRRLNIIIQPNLRFMYELFKWEEQEKLKQDHLLTNLREVDWFIMCREIMKLNLPYLTK